MNRQEEAMLRKLGRAVAGGDKREIARIVLNLPARLKAELLEALKISKGAAE